MTRIFSFTATIIFSLSFLGVAAQKISKTDCEFYYAEMNKYKDSTGVLEKKLEKCSTQTSTLEEGIDKLNERLAKYKSKIPLLSDLEYRVIGTKKWAAYNLTEEQVKQLIPKIKSAQDKEDWEKFSEEPAYCYHIEDLSKKNGVLLNTAALAELHKILNEDKTIQWRLPVPDDFNNITSFLKELKFANVFNLLATTKDAPEPRWLKPGVDLFDMHIAPLSYRRNSINEWSGKTEASFYCLNKKDVALKQNIYIAYIYDYNTSSPIEVESKEITKEESNFGIYVRLIGRD